MIYNVKNIIRFLDELNKKHTTYYELLLYSDKTYYEETIQEITKNMKKLFMKHKLNNYIFDCYSSKSYFLVEVDENKGGVF